MSLFRVVTSKTGKERKHKMSYLRSKDKKGHVYEVYGIKQWGPEVIELELSIYGEVPIAEVLKWKEFFGTDLIDIGFDDGYYAYSEYTWGHDHKMLIKIKNPTINTTIEELDTDGNYQLS